MAEPLEKLLQSITSSIGLFGQFSSVMQEAARRTAESSAKAQQLAQANGSVADSLSKMIASMRQGTSIERQHIENYKQWYKLARDVEKEIKQLAAFQDILNFKCQSFAGRMGTVIGKLQLANSNFKQLGVTLAGLHLSFDRLGDVATKFGRTMFDATRLATRYGESATAVEAAFKKVSQTTTLSRQGFAELVKSFKELQTGVPLTTKAIADFAEAMMGRLGYSEEMVIERTRELIQTQAKLPNLFDRITRTQDAFKKSTNEGNAAAGRLRMTLRALGASAPELERVMDAVTPTSASVSKYLEFDKAMSKFNQRAKDSELTIAQKMQPTMENLANATSKIAEIFSKVDAALMNIGGHIGIIVSTAAPFINMLSGGKIMAALGARGAIAQAGGLSAGTTGAGAAVAGLFGLRGAKAAGASITSAAPLLPPASGHSSLRLMPRGTPVGGVPVTLTGVSPTAARASGAGFWSSAASKFGGAAGLGRTAIGGAKGFWPMALVGGLISGGQEYMERKGSGASTGRALGAGVARGGASALGGLGGAAGGAALGAAIGSVVPVLGTAVGAGIGMFLGGVGGSMLGDWGGKKLGGAIAGPGKPDDIRRRDAMLERAALSKTRDIGGMMTAQDFAGAQDILDQEQAGVIDIKQAREEILKLVQREASTEKGRKLVQDLISQGMVTMTDLSKIYGGNMAKVEEAFKLTAKDLKEINPAAMALNQATQQIQRNLDAQLITLKNMQQAFQNMMTTGEQLSQLQERGMFGGGYEKEFDDAARASQELAVNVRQQMEAEVGAMAIAYPEQMAKVFGSNMAEAIKQSGGEDFVNNIKSKMARGFELRGKLQVGGLGEKEAEEARAELDKINKEIQDSVTANADKINAAFTSQGLDLSNFNTLDSVLSSIRDKLNSINDKKASGVKLTEEEKDLQTDLGIQYGNLQKYKQQILDVTQKQLQAETQALESVFKPYMAANEKSIDLAKMRMTLAEQNNLGLVKSYQYTREVVGLMSKQISMTDQQNQAYDVALETIGQRLGVDVDINRAMEDREGFMREMQTAMKNHGIQGAQLANEMMRINTYLDKRAEGEKKILSIATEQAQLTRQVREGYLDAMQEYVSNAGDFSALIGTSTAGVTQLIAAGAPGTFKAGAVGKMPAGARGVPPKWSATSLGAMTGTLEQENPLSLYGNLDASLVGLNPLDPRQRSKTVSDAARRAGMDLAGAMSGRGGVANQAALDARLETVANNTSGQLDLQDKSVRLLQGIYDQLGGMTAGDITGSARALNPRGARYGSPTSEAGQGFYDRGIGGISRNAGIEQGPAGFFGFPSKPVGGSYDLKASGGYVINNRAVAESPGLVSAISDGIFAGGIPGQDSIPLYAQGGPMALVQQGEALVTDPSMFQMAAAINSGKMRGYASGGRFSEAQAKRTSELIEWLTEIRKKQNPNAGPVQLPKKTFLTLDDYLLLARVDEDVKDDKGNILFGGITNRDEQRRLGIDIVADERQKAHFEQIEGARQQREDQKARMRDFSKTPQFRKMFIQDYKAQVRAKQRLGIPLGEQDNALLGIYSGDAKTVQAKVKATMSKAFELAQNSYANVGPEAAHNAVQAFFPEVKAALANKKREQAMSGLLADIASNQQSGYAAFSSNPKDRAIAAKMATMPGMTREYAQWSLEGKQGTASPTMMASSGAGTASAPATDWASKGIITSPSSGTDWASKGIIVNPSTALAQKRAGGLISLPRMRNGGGISLPKNIGGGGGDAQEVNVKLDLNKQVSDLLTADAWGQRSRISP